MKATTDNLKMLDRLLKRSDFLRVNQSGAKWVSKSMIVLAAPNDGARIRYGITATKKLEKTAVGRNRMKRRLRAAAAGILGQVSRDGIDYVLIARHETATRAFTDLEKDLRWCIERLGHGR